MDVSIDIRLIPFSETGMPPLSHVSVERNLAQGMILKMGRQVFKEGQVMSKANEHGMDIWFVSKVVSRHHAEIWNKDGQMYIRDVGSSSGTFLNKMRLSPSGKGSRPYPLKDGDVLQFGVDYKGKTEDIFKSIVLKVGFVDQWAQLRRKQANPVKFQNALHSLLLATNPYASSSAPAITPETNVSTECCICINTIGPYQALFISPCSHCFHFKCVSSILSQSAMFPCPIMESIADSSFKDAVESDSDVSVTVDEQGTAIQSNYPAPIQTQLQQVIITPPSKRATFHFRPQTAQSHSPNQAQPNQPRPRSAEEGKHNKSFAAKISGFLGRKHTSTSPAVAGPSHVFTEMPQSPVEPRIPLLQAPEVERGMAGRANNKSTSSMDEDLAGMQDMTVEIEGNTSDHDSDMIL